MEAFAMERILPIDLENTHFRRSLVGYDRRRVDETVLRASKTLEAVLTENAQLKAEIEHLRAECLAYRSQENSLRDAILVAQRAADDLRSAAQRQADALLEEARMTGYAERVAASRALSETRWDLERMRQERANFRSDFQALLTKFHREISPDPLPTEPIPELAALI
jgi:cell division initiation protein